MGDTEHPGPVMPAEVDVEAVEPPAVEVVPPFTDSVDSEQPARDPVAPVFDVDAPAEPDPAPRSKRKTKED